MTPQIGGMYRFPSGIRVVLGAPDADGYVAVAQPLVMFHPPRTEIVLMDEDFKHPYAYPGLSFLLATTIDTEYQLGEVINMIDGRPWKHYTTVRLKDDETIKAIATRKARRKRKAVKKKLAGRKSK